VRNDQHVRATRKARRHGGSLSSPSRGRAPQVAEAGRDNRGGEQPRIRRRLVTHRSGTCSRSTRSAVGRRPDPRTDPDGQSQRPAHAPASAPPRGRLHRHRGLPGDEPDDALPELEQWRRHQHLAPNEALVWHAIRDWKARGRGVRLGGFMDYKQMTGRRSARPIPAQVAVSRRRYDVRRAKRAHDVRLGLGGRLAWRPHLMRAATMTAETEGARRTGPGGGPWSGSAVAGRPQRE
jgi:hypothetical protein